MPRVGVIAHQMEGQPTGVGRYLGELLKASRRIANEWQWVLFFRGRHFDNALWEDSRFEPVFCDSPRRIIAWEQLTLPFVIRDYALDLLFSPSYSLPWTNRIPSIVTIHDLSFELLPGEFAFRERWRRRILARNACRRAGVVFTVSNQIKSQLVSHYSLPEDKVTIVPNGVSLDHQTNTDKASLHFSEAVANLGIRKPYFLCLGTVLPRRHYDTLIAAFGQLKNRFPDHTLVLAGANRLPQPQLIERWLNEHGVADRCVRLGYVDEKHVPALYAQCDLTFYLSSYEGFGIPAIESLAAGIPVVIGNCPSVTERWSHYPLQCQPNSVESVVNTATHALCDKKYYRGIAEKGSVLGRQLTWERAAAKMISSFDNFTTEKMS